MKYVQIATQVGTGLRAAAVAPCDRIRWTSWTLSQQGGPANAFMGGKSMTPLHAAPNPASRRHLRSLLKTNPSHRHSERRERPPGTAPASASSSGLPQPGRTPQQPSGPTSPRREPSLRAQTACRPREEEDGSPRARTAPCREPLQPRACCPSSPANQARFSVFLFRL